MVIWNRACYVSNVCLYSLFVLFCVYVAAIRRADPPSKESYRLCIWLRNWKSGQGPTNSKYPTTSSTRPQCFDRNRLMMSTRNMQSSDTSLWQTRRGVIAGELRWIISLRRNKTQNACCTLMYTGWLTRRRPQINNHKSRYNLPVNTKLGEYSRRYV
jgi:hypothetical protein